MRLDGEGIHQSGDLSTLRLMGAEGRTALICTDDEALSGRISEAVQTLDYEAFIVPSSYCATGRPEPDLYPLIVLDERGGGTDPENNPLLGDLRRMPMASRRKVFLCLLSDTMPSLDYLGAFRVGANLVLNFKDIEKMPMILERLLKEYEALYAAFIDELSKRGTSSV